MTEKKEQILKNVQQIVGRVQHYQWGGSEGCMVSTMTSCKEGPFAEIWYGSHKRLPSFLYGTEEPLEFELPFLLKFLSINKPLSLQIHPDKQIAERLFKEGVFALLCGKSIPHKNFCAEFHFSKKHSAQAKNSIFFPHTSIFSAQHKFSVTFV